MKALVKHHVTCLIRPACTESPFIHQPGTGGETSAYKHHRQICLGQRSGSSAAHRRRTLVSFSKYILLSQDGCRQMLHHELS